MVLPSTWSKSQNPGSVKGLGEMWSDMLKSLTASLEHAREELQRESIPEAVLIVTGQLRDGVESATSLTRKTVVDVILPLGHSTLSLMRKKASQITARDDLKPMLSYLNKTRMWIRRNPRAVCSAAGLIFIVWPSLVYKPVLWLLGFGERGVGGGSYAAKSHRGIGDVRRHSPFATSQSAGAGGRGRRVFAHLVRTAVLVGAVWWGLVVVARRGSLEGTWRTAVES
ncbi:hypothetical protein DL546_000453 [Coniochaeta pulveracea]|uniref:Uncharacterized protein n=1 Tax=Coniochaeta pulveracea TaxID=177199 RepID=A0A420XWW5_9PEZI|nr:hypothetical protein DL546_000453 [Coniochaeta pulveracea]